jgi:uncharacterized repeat protein (TIGR02543 family)
VGGDTADIVYQDVPPGTVIGTRVPAPIRANYDFAGWRYDGQAAGTPNLTSEYVAALEIYYGGRVTFTAQWTPLTVTVTFEGLGGIPAQQTARVRIGDVYASALASVTNPARSGFVFLGWFTQPRGGTQVTSSTVVTMRGNHNLYAHWGGGDDGGESGWPGGETPGGETPGGEIPEGVTPAVTFHLSFMYGYPGGLLMPYGYITRAEAAALMVRAIIPGAATMPEGEIPGDGDVFSDVTHPDWFYRYVAIAYARGWIQGYPGGEFNPGRHITRQEFIALLARTTTRAYEHEERPPFADSDMISDWAVDHVYTAFTLGWIVGDDRGLFNPRNNITRNEAATAVNRRMARGRITAASLENVLPGVLIFPDSADPGKWYYYQMIEATNNHWIIIENDIEIWTHVDNP